MAQLRNTWHAFFIAIITIFTLKVKADGLATSYCSPENTAGDVQGEYNQYQTNEACQNVCQGSYAFAVLQGYYCWCSNYVPADQVNTYGCNQACPGYGTEWCGSTDAGLYAYFLLSGGEPIGTAGAAASSSSSAHSTSYSSSVSTPQKTSTSVSSSSPTLMRSSLSSLTNVVSSQSSKPTSKTVIDSSSTSSRIVLSAVSNSIASASSTYYPPATSSSDNSYTSYYTPTSDSAEPSPTAIYTSLVTAPGSTKTILVTPTIDPAASGVAGLSQSSQEHQSSFGGGKIAGVVIGALLTGVLLAAAIWFVFRRRTRSRLHDETPDGAYTPPSAVSTHNNIPSRQMSQLSSAGLLGKTPRLQTTGLAAGNDPRSADTMSSNFDRRSVGTDQRLNPYALYMHEEARLSGVSLQDNQDYSRQLRVANPDA